MGTITILNGTNTMINSCISAGVNYSWCNKLSPERYYKHEGAAGVYTLNTNWWAGESTEYSNSAAVIGTFVGALVLGVVGVALIPFTGGTSASAVVASAATLAGVFTTSAGLALSGIGIAIEDFRNEPSKFTNIQALQDRKFIAEATAEWEVDERKNESPILTYTNLPNIQLRELQHEEYLEYIEEKGYTEHQSKPIVGSYITASMLRSIGVLDMIFRIQPVLGGDACWEIEDDQTRESAPIQLWSRQEDEVHWRIQPVDVSDDTDEFYIYNPSLQRYVTAGTKLDGRITSSKNHQSRQKFHIVRQYFPRGHLLVPCHFFIPVDAKNRVVISENGNLGDSTKLILGSTTTTHPGWAAWKLDPV